jgi:hypothetical protein
VAARTGCSWLHGPTRDRPGAGLGRYGACMSGPAVELIWWDVAVVGWRWRYRNGTATAEGTCYTRQEAETRLLVVRSRRAGPYLEKPPHPLWRHRPVLGRGPE